ncbi:MAG: c-type cytochrome [Williamsia sp.]|nr:c-type cytochrome [Williamsia sp.]
MKKMLTSFSDAFVCVCMAALCAFKTNNQPVGNLGQALQTNTPFFLQPVQTQRGSASAKTQPSPKKPVAAKAKPGAVASSKPTAQTEPHEGEALITKSDCLVCHKINTRFVGPAYTDVAQKYASDKGALQALTDKVIKGGTGVWGQVPMAPHPQLAREDAQKMVAYILSLKEK